MKWITDWSEIEEDAKYIICAINRSNHGDKGLFLSGPQIYAGWQVKRLMEKCYAALPMPEFQVLTGGE